MGNKLGTESELLFQYLAAKEGYIVSTPHGPRKYDFVLDNGVNLYRIQVKSSLSPREKRGKTDVYGVALTCGHVRSGYAPADVDFFAVYLQTCDTWYFIPFEFMEGGTVLKLNPISKRSKYNAFKNNWKIFDSTHT